MAIVTTDNQHYSDIADAIRDKGVNGVFKPDEMAAAISGISTGIAPSGSLSISANGSYDVSQYAQALVNVPGGASSWVYNEKITVATEVAAHHVLTPELSFNGSWTIALIAIYSLDEAQRNTSMGRINFDSNKSQWINAGSYSQAHMSMLLLRTEAGAYIYGTAGGIQVTITKAYDASLKFLFSKHYASIPVDIKGICIHN